MNKAEYLNGLEDFFIKLKYEEKAESTLKKYYTDLTKFSNFINDEEISKDHVILYKKFLIDVYNPVSVNSYLVILNKYLKYLNREDLTVKQLRIQRKQTLEDVLSVGDFHRLLRMAKRVDDMETYYIMKILGTTGIRISELNDFTAKNIKNNSFNVTNKGKTRRVYLRKDLARDLRKFCRKNKINDDLIFKLNRSTIWRRLRKYAGIAKVKKEKVHPHSFRHMFSKNYLEQTSNDYMGLMNILGHYSLNTTMIYQVSTDNEIKNKLNKMKF